MTDTPRKPHIGPPRNAAPRNHPPRNGPSPTVSPGPRSDRPRRPLKPGGDTAPAKSAGGGVEPVRIAKAMARAGLCSRREAERWIAEGRVRVNGTLLTTPALDVGPRHKILVDGKPLPLAEPVRLWRYHKPKGLVTTHADPEGRPTVFESLPAHLPRVISIGRLDFNTEGLLLLTNDGELARHLELPETGWLRRYRVRARGRVTEADLEALKAGVEIEGVQYGPVEAAIDSFSGANVWLTLGLREGKNREVRKILGSLGLEVGRLIRISFGPFQLLDLKEGEVENVQRRVLADQLGPRLAAEFGLLGEAEPPRPKRGKPPRPSGRSEGAAEGPRPSGIRQPGRVHSGAKHPGAGPSGARPAGGRSSGFGRSQAADDRPARGRPTATGKPSRFASAKGGNADGAPGRQPGRQPGRPGGGVGAKGGKRGPHGPPQRGGAPGPRRPAKR